MGGSIQWLKDKVDAISFDEKKYRISVGDNKYVFGAIINQSHPKNKPDFFAISSIYDTIVDVNNKIKYSFYMAVNCNPSESLEDHIWFGKPQKNEEVATYFIENMVFRTTIIWDLLAQLCNELWLVGKPIDKIYAEQFFHDLSQGKKARKKAIEFYSYFEQEDEVKGNTEIWNGNHEYIKDYRNKMTHRNSPNISTLSSFAQELRPPAIFVLKRVTEDYLQATQYIVDILDEADALFAKPDFHFFPSSNNDE